MHPLCTLALRACPVVVAAALLGCTPEPEFVVDTTVFEDPALLDDPSCTHLGENVADYMALPEQFADARRQISEPELSDLFTSIESGGVGHREGELDPEELRDVVLEALRTPFLFADLETRPLRWARFPADPGDPWGGERLVLHDPVLGCFPALALVPDGDGPHPTVQALHGHTDTPRSYTDDYFGTLYQDTGALLFVAGTRAFNGDAWEDRVTREMLLNGFTMMGVRVAEHLIGYRYLRSRADVDPSRIGLIGHSGGSIAGNLTVRVEPRYAGYVSDATGAYHNIGEGGLLVDETAPSVFPLQYLVNDFGTSEVPVLQVPYQYTDGPEPIFDFFDATLG